MAAVAEPSTAFVSSFLTVGTPTGFLSLQSPRDTAETTPRRKDSWGNVFAAPGSLNMITTDDSKGISKVSILALTTSAAPPATMTMHRTSASTLSLGEGQDAVDVYLDAPVQLGRFASDDFMAVFSQPSDSAAAEAQQQQQWALAGIAEDARSPTNVDFEAPAALPREKSTDFVRVDALVRAQSDDLANLLLLRRRSSNMLYGLGLLGEETSPASSAAAAAKPSSDTSAADETPNCPPNSAESLGPLKEEDEKSSSSSDSESEEEMRRQEQEPSRRQSARNVGKPKRKLADLDDESDEEYMPSASTKKHSSHKKSKKASSAAASHRAGASYSHNNRGAHVRGRPEMQETARNGQRHWATEVQELRDQWSEARCAEANPAFQAQLELMARRHIKNQHECLLRALHIAAAKGMVDPLPFNTAEGKSFLGWTGFEVRPERAAEFREAVESMFPAPLLENTLHNTFRRAGLVPSSWSEAWLGLAPFGYKKPVS